MKSLYNDIENSEATRLAYRKVIATGIHIDYNLNYIDS
jgi:hypothetical protein